uniref:Uncharacterized protein n=1 Tax=Oryza glumipatula TaxID=40148 RepID=A0A0D9Z6T0_9ORYZ
MGRSMGRAVGRNATRSVVITHQELPTPLPDVSTPSPPCQMSVDLPHQILARKTLAQPHPIKLPLYQLPCQPKLRFSICRSGLFPNSLYLPPLSSDVKHKGTCLVADVAVPQPLELCTLLSLSSCFAGRRRPDEVVKKKRGKEK